MEHVGPLTFNGIRFALGALVLVPVIKWRNANGKSGEQAFLPLLQGGPDRRDPRFSPAPLSSRWGLVYTTAGKAGFITGLYVIIVPIFGLFLGMRPTLGGWFGATLALVGLYFLSVTESFTLAPGDFWVLLGALFWALHVIILSRFSPKMDTVRLACAQFAVCSFLSLAGATITETVTAAGLQGAAIPILYGGILSVGTAYTLQVVAQKDAPRHPRGHHSQPGSGLQRIVRMAPAGRDHGLERACGMRPDARGHADRPALVRTGPGNDGPPKNPPPQTVCVD